MEILKDLNNITDVDKINEGQMLEIPGFTYTVKPKDTLSKISRLVGVSVKDLKQINGLSSDMISPNQIIKVVYNDSDFAVSSDNKKVTYDSATNTKTEVVNMKNTAKAFAAILFLSSSFIDSYSFNPEAMIPCSR